MAGDSAAILAHLGKLYEEGSHMIRKEEQRELRNLGSQWLYTTTVYHNFISAVHCQPLGSGSVIVLHCCVTNHYTFSSLGQHTFIVSQSLWFRSLGIGNPGLLLWVFQAEIKVTGTAFSPKAWDLLPSSLVLTVTHFLVVITSKSQSQALNPGLFSNQLYCAQKSPENLFKMQIQITTFYTASLVALWDLPPAQLSPHVNFQLILELTCRLQWSTRLHLELLINHIPSWAFPGFLTPPTWLPYCLVAELEVTGMVLPAFSPTPVDSHSCYLSSRHCSVLMLITSCLDLCKGLPHESSFCVSWLVVWIIGTNSSPLCKRIVHPSCCHDLMMNGPWPGAW